ncbi:phage holin family protein [Sulfurimonas sp.]
MKEVSIAQYTIALLELFEAEGRNLKKEVVKTGVLLGFIFLGFSILFVSVIFLLWGIYSFFITIMSPAWAGVSISGICFIIAVMIFGIVKWQKQ